jgi:hypothetical protein
MGTSNSAPFGLDLTNLPSWISLVVLTVYVFRQQIGSFIPEAFRDHFRHRARRQADREEFEQDLIASQIDQESAEILIGQGREMRLMALLEKKDEWVQGRLVKEIECLHDGQNRTNELLSQIHTTLTEMKVR